MDKLNFMNSVKVQNPKRSVFDLTHEVKLSGNMGFLIPSQVFDLVPGDRVNLATEALIRFAPMVAPVYSRFNVTFHSWAIPYRILWDKWADYITETKTAGVLPSFPTATLGPAALAHNILMDYMGIPPYPTGVATRSEVISPLRFAAYQCVYNEFYRDENLITPVPYKLTEGDNSGNAELFKIRKRAWSHDYFTSNLPFAQKGDAVDLPLGEFSNVPVRINEGTGLQYQDTSNWVSGINNVQPNAQGKYDPDFGVDEMWADNSNLVAAATTINELRLAEQLQKYLERAARAGTRLVEWIKGMFAETLPDYTAQRPQYIGGTMSPVQVSEVLNTTGETGGLPQGNMSGRAISVNSGNMGSYHAREHCVVVTMMSILPVVGYQQGIEREFSKVNDPKDFLNPLFAHLGEQETKNSEIAAFLDAYSGNTFGYLPRYSEYRTIPNRVAGDFRTTLNYWTADRIFDLTTPPLLNQTFIESDPTHRIFADTDPDDQKLYIHILNRVRAVRPLPKYGTPSL